MKCRNQANGPVKPEGSNPSGQNRADETSIKPGQFFFFFSALTACKTLVENVVDCARAVLSEG